MEGKFVNHNGCNVVVCDECLSNKHAKHFSGNAGRNDCKENVFISGKFINQCSCGLGDEVYNGTGWVEIQCGEV